MITGVSPSEGPTTGGTVVTITGSGFVQEGWGGLSWDPAVYFGDFRAPSLKLVDSNTMTVTTPAHHSGAVDVSVQTLYRGKAVAQSAFKYTGNDADAFERLLVPVFVSPIAGAYGSEFRSALQIFNDSQTPARIVFGWECGVIIGTPCVPYTLLDGGERWLLEHPPGGPARIVYVYRDGASGLSMNLRAYDTSRASTNFGTEIPVVPTRSFRDTVALTGIPNDPRFRLMLRVYCDASPRSSTAVRLTFGGQSSTLHLRPAGLFEPAYAELYLTVPVGVTAAALSLKVESLAPSPDVPPTPIWAFVTVTNNETQHITTITPQPSR